MRRARIPLFALALGACTEDEDLPHFGTLRYEGENLEVWASEGLSPCGGTYPYLDAWLTGFREHLGGSARPQHQIYYWLDAEDYEETTCPQPSDGCALWGRNRVYSRQIPCEHELVHAELDTMKSSSIFTEGVAELFGSNGSLTGDPRSYPLDDLLGQHDRIPYEGYRTAGRFSRYLTETYGLEQFLDVVRASPRGGGRLEIAQTFASVLDEDLDEIVADFETYAPCSTVAWRYFDYECLTMPTTPWVSPDLWEVSLDVHCDEEAIGPRNGHFWTLRAFDVAEPGEYRITGSTDDNARVYIVPCAISCYDEESPRALGGFVAAALNVRMERGRYWVRTEVPDGASTSLELAIRRVGD